MGGRRCSSGSRRRSAAAQPSDDELWARAQRAVGPLPARSGAPEQRAVGHQPAAALGLLHGRRTPRSGCPTGCRACRSGWSTTCCCTSWPTCSSPSHGPEFWALLDGLSRRRAGAWIPRRVVARRCSRPASATRRSRRCTRRRTASSVSSGSAVDGEPAHVERTPALTLRLRVVRRDGAGTARRGGGGRPAHRGRRCRSSRTGSRATSAQGVDPGLLRSPRAARPRPACGRRARGDRRTAASSPTLRCRPSSTRGRARVDDQSARRSGGRGGRCATQPSACAPRWATKSRRSSACCRSEGGCQACRRSASADCCSVILGVARRAARTGRACSSSPVEDPAVARRTPSGSSRSADVRQQVRVVPHGVTRRSASARSPRSTPERGGVPQPAGPQLEADQRLEGALGRVRRSRDAGASSRAARSHAGSRSAAARAVTSSTHPSTSASSVSSRSRAACCSGVVGGSKTPDDMSSAIACGLAGSMPPRALSIAPTCRRRSLGRSRRLPASMRPAQPGRVVEEPHMCALAKRQVRGAPGRRGSRGPRRRRRRSVAPERPRSRGAASGTPTSVDVSTSCGERAQALADLAAEHHAGHLAHHAHERGRPSRASPPASGRQRLADACGHPLGQRHDERLPPRQGLLDPLSAAPGLDAGASPRAASSRRRARPRRVSTASVDRGAFDRR